MDDARSTKRRLRATAGWLVPLMAGLLQFAAPGQTPDPRKALVTDNAIIYYHRSDKRNALKVAEAIRINLPRIRPSGSSISLPRTTPGRGCLERHSRSATSSSSSPCRRRRLFKD